MDDARVTFVGGAGLAAMLVGLLMHLSSLPQISDAKEQAGRYMGYLEQLDTYEREATEAQSAIAGWELLAVDGERVSLDAVVDRSLKGRNATVSRRGTEALMSDWQVQRVDVAIPDVPVDAALAFVSDAESISPPWRMVACDIRPGAAHAGRGDVKLELVQITAVAR